jgi:cytochrome oxidase Cu insertion factor (SCO1/SenC/PrrC family)
MLYLSPTIQPICSVGVFMKKFCVITIILLALALSICKTTVNAEEKKFNTENIKVGQLAPDFMAEDVVGRSVNLGQYKNQKNIVIVTFFGHS